MVNADGMLHVKNTRVQEPQKQQECTTSTITKTAMTIHTTRDKT